MLAKEEGKKNVDAIQFAGEMYHHEGSGPTTEEMNKAAARGSSLTQKKEQAEKDLTYTKKYMDAKWDMVESTEQSLLNFYAELGLEEDYRRLEEMKAEFERNPSYQLAQEHDALVDSVRQKEQKLKVYEKSYQDTVEAYNALGQQGQEQWKTYQEIWDEWDKDRRVTHYMMDDYQENNWDLLSEEAKAALQGHDNDQNEGLQSSIDWIDGRFLEIDSEIENVQKIHDEKLMYYREYYDEHGEYPKSYPEIEAELNSYQERIHGLEAEKKQRQQTQKNETNELNFRRQYVGLKYNDDFQEYASYAPAEQGAFSIVSDTKDTYYRINNVPVARGIFDKWDTSKDHLKEMKPDEIDIFNYLYQKQGEDEAQKYIEDITPVLYRRQRESKEKAIADFAEESWGNSALASVNSILTKPLEGFSYLGQGIDYLMDGEIDENAPYNAFVYENQAARSAVSKKIEKQWGEAGSFLYQLGMGIGDFAYTLLLSHGLAAGAGAAGLSTGAVAKTASRISLAIMSTEAAAETVLDAKDRGLEDKDAFWLGTIAGATELVTEKVSIEKLLDKVGMGKNALTYLLKNALAEGSEEMASDAVNWLADVMISQDKSEWEETLLYYRALGFSEDEAFLAAMKEQGKQLLKDGAAGAITGTIMSGGRLAGSKIQDGIQNYRNYKGAVQNGKQYYALNQLTQGGLARSLGNMNVEQSYRSMSPEAILKNSALSPTEARFLLESNGYSVKDSPQLPSLLRDGEGGQPQRDETSNFSQNQGQNRIDNSTQDDTLEMYRKLGTHRRKSADGKYIIDKPTYNKITRKAVKHGADIVIADEEGQRHLQKMGASALTMNDMILIRPDATLSDVLEETYHFMQNISGLNDQYEFQQRTILNEIDAKEYLLRMTDKYKIPANEVEVTKRQLASYKAQMEDLKKRGEWHD